MKKQNGAKVHDLTAERARRGRVPWDFTLDLARDHHRIAVYQGAGPHDLLAMAESCERVGRMLLKAARTLRTGAGMSGRTRRSGAK